MTRIGIYKRSIPIPGHLAVQNNPFPEHHKGFLLPGHLPFQNIEEVPSLGSIQILRVIQDFSIIGKQVFRSLNFRRLHAIK
jgi:hypothetical protein